MRAVSCSRGNLDVVELDDPQPQKGQLVLTVRHCGDFMRADTPIVTGHEFSGEIAEGGRGVAKECVPTAAYM